MERTEWFKRKFPKIEDSGRLPTILERLEGTSFRIANKVKNIDEDHATRVVDGKWSIKKEIGHLIDLEPLWIGRADDLLNGVDILGEADLANKKTHISNHDSRSLDSLLSEVNDLRTDLIKKIRSFSNEDIERTALHPRLKTPMQIVDLAYFVAEHDDHHLSQISWLINKLEEV